MLQDKRMKWEDTDEHQTYILKKLTSNIYLLRLLEVAACQTNPFVSAKRTNLCSIMSREDFFSN